MEIDDRYQEPAVRQKDGGWGGDERREKKR
jgi:hypothetical protein